MSSKRRVGENSVNIWIDTSAIENMVKSMETKLENVVRPTAQAGAQVLYDAVRASVQALPSSKTGNLYSAIYQVYSQDHSNTDRATYHVSWNHTKAPHGINVEFGHIQRYRMVRYADGSVRPMVRPEMRGKPRPDRSREARDAYYVRLPADKQVAGSFFFRGVIYNQAIRDSALANMQQAFTQKLNSK